MPVFVCTLSCFEHKIVWFGKRIIYIKRT